MSRLIMWNVVTLDGFFEGPALWDISFHDDIWGDELEQLSLEQLRGADGLVFGRVTYEGMAAYWPTAEGEVADLMNGLPKVVCSRTLERADWSTTTIVRDAAGEIAALKRSGDGDLFVMGSGNLSESLTQAGLFDEYRLAVAPVALGDGKPLFGRGGDQLKLDLLEARTLSTGGVVLRYAPRGT